MTAYITRIEQLEDMTAEPLVVVVVVVVVVVAAAVVVVFPTPTLVRTTVTARRHIVHSVLLRP